MRRGKLGIKVPNFSQAPSKGRLRVKTWDSKFVPMTNSRKRGLGVQIENAEFILLPDCQKKMVGNRAVQEVWGASTETYLEFFFHIGAPLFLTFHPGNDN